MNNEELECLLRARIREIKGFAGKAKLSVVREDQGQQQPGGKKVNEVMVCRLMALARKKWPEDYVAKPALRLIQGGRSS